METTVNRNDIRIELHLKNREAFSSELIRYYLEKVEKAVYRADISELSYFQRELPQEFGPLFDAVRYRAEFYRTRTFNIDKVASGSLLLSGVAAGLTIWLFDKTFGESFKEAWKKTDHHAHLVNILSTRLHWRANKIASHIGQRREPFLGPMVEEKESEPFGQHDEVSTQVLVDQGGILVRAEISVKEGRLPSISEAVSSQQDRRDKDA
jgi:hypothetical protein